MQLTNSMEMRPSLEAASSSDSQELSEHLRSHRFHYHGYKNHQRIPNLSQIILVHKSPSNFSDTHFNYILGLPSLLFPSSIPTRILYTSIFSPKHATCPAYAIHFYLNILFIQVFGKKVQLTMVHIMNFFEPPTI
jgi:glutaredoxin-related protein